MTLFHSSSAAYIVVVGGEGITLSNADIRWAPLQRCAKHGPYPNSTAFSPQILSHQDSLSPLVLLPTASLE